MAQHTKDKVRVKRTNSYVVVDSSHGVCQACLGELELRLDRLFVRRPFYFKAEPHSHIIVSSPTRLATHLMNKVSHAVNDAINNCHRLHPQP